MSHPTDDRPPREPRRSASNPKPKGILKNAASLGGQQRLQWDEENLALTEIQKDSLMKIDEPKTPYVRYNVETDEVEGDIPQLELGGARSPGLPTESLPESPTSGIASGPSSRRESLSSVGKNSSGRSGSVASSRSTSFSLPNDSTRTEVKAGENELVDSDVEDDESMDEEAVAKHAEFVEARNRHYSKEAEAMKRAASMPDEEDEEPGKDAENELAGDRPEEGSVAAGQLEVHGHGLTNGAMHP